MTNPLLLLLGLMAAVTSLLQPVVGLFLVLFLSPIKTAGDEILLFARLLGMIVVLSILMRTIAQKTSLRWLGTEVPVMVIGLGMSMSFFRTSNVAEVASSLLSLTSLYALSLVIFNLAENEGRLKNLSLMFLVSAVYPIVQALLEGREPDPNRVFTRVSGTFTIPTGLGGFLIPVTLLAVALLFSPGFSRVVRLLIFSVFGGGVVALFMTLTRGAIYGVAGGLILLLLLIRRHKGSPLAVLLILIAVGAAVWSLWPALEGRVINPVVDLITTGNSTVGVTQRTDELSLLIPITLDNYFMGTGIGNYRREVLRYQVIYAAPDLPSTPHNVFLYFFGEVGLVAALGFIWLVIWVIRQVMLLHGSITSDPQGVRLYVYIGALCGLIAYIPFIITHNGFYTNEMWLVLGLLLAAMYRVSPSAPIAKPDNPTPKRNARRSVSSPALRFGMHE